jgi:hypothetical protein
VYAVSFFSFYDHSTSPTELWTWLGSASPQVNFGYTVQFSSAGGFFVQPEDRTFAIYGSPVPEPSSLLLTSLGVVVASAAHFVRRRAQVLNAA